MKQNTVRIVDHDPGWPAMSARECEVLGQALGDLVVDIQHVGSTAVPGLPAKPILDIAIAARAPDRVTAIIERLTGIGYIYRGDAGDDAGHVFVRETEPDIRTLYVHVVEQGSTQWRNYIHFRDTLHGDAVLRRRYAELKSKLVKRFPADRRAYTAAKSDFIWGVLNSEGRA